MLWIERINGLSRVVVRATLRCARSLHRRHYISEAPHSPSRFPTPCIAPQSDISSAPIPGSLRSSSELALAVLRRGVRGRISMQWRARSFISSSRPRPRRRYYLVFTHCTGRGLRLPTSCCQLRQRHFVRWGCRGRKVLTFTTSRGERNRVRSQWTPFRISTTPRS